MEPLLLKWSSQVLGPNGWAPDFSPRSGPLAPLPLSFPPPHLLRRTHLRIGRVHCTRNFASLAKITCAHLFVVLPPNTGPIELTARVANPPVLGSPRTPVRRRQGPEYGKPGPGALPLLCFDMRTRSRIRRIFGLLHLPSLRPLLGGLGSLFEPPPLLLCQVLVPGQCHGHLPSSPLLLPMGCQLSAPSILLCEHPCLLFSLPLPLPNPQLFDPLLLLLQQLRLSHFLLELSA